MEQRAHVVRLDLEHLVVAAAREDKIDLVVVRTHGRTGLEHAVLGSVAERVVKHAHCPVLVVRPTAW